MVWCCCYVAKWLLCGVVWPGVVVMCLSGCYVVLCSMVLLLCALCGVVLLCG